MTSQSDIEKFLLNQVDRFAVADKVSPERITGMAEDLTRYELAAIEKAFAVLRRTNDYFPTVAAVVRLLEGSADSRAELAWRTIQDAAACAEAEYVSAYVYDPAMAYAIESFQGEGGRRGWPALCDFLDTQTTPMIANAAKSFKSAYQLAADGLAKPTSQYLLGTSEATNLAASRENSAWATLAQKNGALRPIRATVFAISTGGYRRLSLHWDPLTMRLPKNVMAELVAGGEDLKKYFPVPVRVDPPSLPAPDDLATPDEVQQMRGAIRGLLGAGEVTSGQ